MSFVALIACAVFLATAAAPVRADALLHNGDFEGGLDGWASSSGASLSLEGGAARVTSVSEAFWQIRSAWIEAEPGAEYGLSGSVRGDGALVDVVTASLEFSRADGSVDHRPIGQAGSLDESSFVSLTGDTTAPAGAAWMRVVLEGSSFSAGGWFDVDAVELVMAEPPPEVVPTVQPSPSPSPTPTLAPGDTATPTPTGTLTPTPSVSPTPTPTATAPVLLPIARSLWNPSFDDGTTAWSASRGEAQGVTGVGGTRGAALLLRAGGTSTAWVEQPVIVDPGGWYLAEASLAPLDGVRAAWVRVAWYASTDASGPQMRTDDSETLASGSGRVSTGPVQAPPDARSAKVRILLQPNAPGARLAIDDVLFAPTDPPPPEASPTPTGTTTPLPTPLALISPPSPSTTPSAETTPSSEPSSAPAATSAAAPFVGSSAPVSGGAVPATGGGTGDQSALRITELLPDAIQPGRDADFEWVELTNLGDAPVNLTGMVLRDEQDATALPSFTVPAGASVVVAGALAEVDADIRLDGAIGNGLGNDGDRLELVDASGNVVDVFEYGPGTELAASPGDSLHRWFDDRGGNTGAMAGVPSPGIYQRASNPEVESTTEADDPPETEPRDRAGEDEAPAVRASEEGDPLAWMLAIALAGGGVGGALVQRLGPSRAR